MAYFKINGVDYSTFVSGLKVTKTHIYTSQTNAAGDTVADYINAKRVIEVNIIPLDAAALASLLTAVDNFDVSLSFLNPQTGAIEENVACIIPSNAIEYYTIQADKTLTKAFNLSFTEL